MYEINEKMGLAMQQHDLISIGKVDQLSEHKLKLLQHRKAANAKDNLSGQPAGVRRPSQKGLILRLVNILLNL